MFPQEGVDRLHHQEVDCAANPADAQLEPEDHVELSVLEPAHQRYKLLDRFLIRTTPFLHRRQFAVSHHPRFRVATGPGNDCSRPFGKQVNVHEGTVFAVETDVVTLYTVFAHMIFVEVQVQRRFQFPSMGTSPRDTSFPPTRQEIGIHGE